MSTETEQQRSNRTLTVVLGALGITVILVCGYVLTHPAGPSAADIAANAAREAAVQQQASDQGAVLTANAQAASAQQAAAQQSAAASAQLAAEAAQRAQEPAQSSGGAQSQRNQRSQDDGSTAPTDTGPP